MGLGSYPAITLVAARIEAAKNRQMVAEGNDPITKRAAETKEIPTFSDCANRFIHIHRPSWKNVKHAQQWLNTLTTYATPVIGSKPVDIITTDDILEILNPIWLNKTETAKRLRGRIEKILDFAAVRGANV